MNEKRFKEVQENAEIIVNGITGKVESIELSNRDYSFLVGTIEEQEQEIKIRNKKILQQEEIIIKNAKDYEEKIQQQQQEIEQLKNPKSIEEWGEEDGDCLWWFFPIVEPPYCGTPLDSDFPDYVTHFTRFLVPIEK